MSAPAAQTGLPLRTPELKELPPENPAAGKIPPLSPWKPNLVAGERLEYEVTLPLGSAGKAVLEVVRQRTHPGPKDAAGKPVEVPVFEVRAKARSSRWLEGWPMNYKVNTEATSLLDADRGFSWLFHIRQAEGDLQRDEKISFFYGEKNLAAYQMRQYGPTTERRRWRGFSLPGKALDSLSALYYLREMKLEAGKTYQLPVVAERKIWVLGLEVEAEEELTVAGLGRRKVWRVRPLMRFGGLFVRKGGLKVWLDQETRIPVRMDAAIPVATVTALLKKHQNSPLDQTAAEAPAKGQ